MLSPGPGSGVESGAKLFFPFLSTHFINSASRLTQVGRIKFADFNKAYLSSAVVFSTVPPVSCAPAAASLSLSFPLKYSVAALPLPSRRRRHFYPLAREMISEIVVLIRF